MNAWLGRMPFALGWLLCAVTAAREPAADELRRLTSDLGATEFAVRERATDKLVMAGVRAIDPLTECVRADNPEASWRATAALVRIAIEGEDVASGRAIDVLAGRGFLGTSAEQLRVKRMQHRGQSAEVSIRSLGGLFGPHLDMPEVGTPEPVTLALEPVHPTLDPIAPGGPISVSQALDIALQKLAALPADVPGPAEPPPAPAPPPDLPPEELAALTRVEPAELHPVQIEPPVGVLIADAFVSPELQESDVLMQAERALTLDESWRGGDEGLADLRHLPDVVSVRMERAALSDAALMHISVLPRLRDMRINRTPFTPAALGRFRQRHPHVTVFVSEPAVPAIKQEARSQAFNR